MNPPAVSILTEACFLELQVHMAQVQDFELLSVNEEAPCTLSDVTALGMIYTESCLELLCQKYKL